MKAIRIHDYRETPQIEDVPTPEIGQGEVLVRVEAAALNPLDVALQTGNLERVFPLSFPYTLGTDLAGTVTEVGEGVTGLRPGDQVVGRMAPALGGAFAEFAAVPAEFCVPLSSSLSTTQAAGIPTAGGTAWVALFVVAGLQAGQKVLIHAGAGGVGSFAVQLARAAGARVYATASGDGVEVVRELGADEVIDYRVQDFPRAVSGMDVVFDTVGGETQRQSFGVLRPGGVLVTSVMPLDEAAARARGVSARMVSLTRSLNGERFRIIVEDIQRQSIRVLIDRTLPLSRFGEALERQGSGRARGKIILTPD